MFDSTFKYVPILETDTDDVKIKFMPKEDLPSMLRARTALAFLHHHGLLRNEVIVLPKDNPFATSNSDFMLWYPSSMSKETVNGWMQVYISHLTRQLEDGEVGGILIAKDSTLSFADQSFTMMLWEELKPDDLKKAFEPSMRWLNDRRSHLRILERMWLEDA